jgi:hypothetical protein
MFFIIRSREISSRLRFAARCLRGERGWSRRSRGYQFPRDVSFFAAAAIIAHVAGSALTLWGANLYFWGRIVYAVAYTAGRRATAARHRGVSGTNRAAVRIRVKNTRSRN